MTYHKRLSQLIDCAHCGQVFEAAHKSRLYCCQSCNTLAWRARQGKSKAATETKRPLEPAQQSTSLELDAKTVGVIALSTAIGNLAVQGGTSVVQHLMQGNANVRAIQPAIRQPHSEALQIRAVPNTEQPADFLPADLQAIAAPRKWIKLPDKGNLAFVRLQHYGHELYYQAEHQLLLWKDEEGQLHAITSARMFARLARYPAPLANQLPKQPQPIAPELAPSPEGLTLDIDFRHPSEADPLMAEALDIFTRTLMQRLEDFPIT